MKRKLNGWKWRHQFLLMAVGVAFALKCPLPANAQQQGPLQYHGGPVLQQFRIYPLYYGNWSEADMQAKQNFLIGLAGYISGQNAPAFEQPMMKQYGVQGAAVAPGVVVATPYYSPGRLTGAQLLNIIHTNQLFGKLPPYSGSTLIMVIPAHGYGLDGCNGCGAYHSAESASAFWTVVPEDVGPNWQVVAGHEVFEAAGDPAENYGPGWDEAVDGCSTAIDLSFGQIPGVTDNTHAGACSTTGYTSLGEYQAYGATFAQFKAEYDRLWPQGWRLYSVQSTVLANGSVTYGAVWRPGTDPEIAVYGWAYGDFRAEYDKLWNEGWRLFILQSYALPSGQVLYNAVWRPGNSPEIQTYGATFASYKAEYDNLWPQGWRLYILQSFVLPDGEVLYNAVWRPGSSAEYQTYGATFASYKAEYDKLWAQGWRLYVLQTYVANGEVLYNAVWRPNTSPEYQTYGATFASYKTEYDKLWPQGWRLYDVQSYVAPNGQLGYNAVWRLGTLDRPL